MTTWLAKFKARRAERQEIKQDQKCWNEIGKILAECRNLGQALGTEYAEWALDRAPSAQAFSDGLKTRLESFDLQSHLPGMPPTVVDRARYEMELAAVQAAQEIIDHPRKRKPNK
jgi:hypothetical protein